MIDLTPYPALRLGRWWSGLETDDGAAFDRELAAVVATVLETAASGNEHCNGLRDYRGWLHEQAAAIRKAAP